MTKTRRFWMASAIALGALAMGACGSDEDPTTSHIFTGPPWEGPERATYDLLNEGGEVEGICILETDPGGDVVTLRRLCEDAAGEGHRDDGQVEAEAETLIPIRSERVLVNTDNNRRTTFTGEYGESAATLGYELFDIETGEVREERKTDRELPEPDDQSPDPGYYDDESLFWLLRGIPLEKDWEGAYHNVNLGVGRIFVAEVHVDDLETVIVEAGEFQAWRIRVRTASVTQIVWVDDAAPHRVVKADIERTTYELRSFE